MAIVFAIASRSAEISRAVKVGKMRKIASKLYTDDLTSPLGEIVRRHRLEIAAHFYPGALISHRSALEADVSPGGKLHLTLPGAVASVRKLPGLEIRIWRGPKPQTDDTRIPLEEGNEVFTSSQTRAILENMQIARAHGGDEPKTLSPTELENRAFWEAYFSNCIEGTKFTVEEVRGIVYDREAAKTLESKRPA
jgi:hypothetical protein